MAGETLIDIRNTRLAKAEQLRSMGINPYPSRSDRTHSSKEIIDNYAQLEGKEVVIAGRLMSWREHGHLVFGHVQDYSGRLQLYIKTDELQPTNVEKGTLGIAELNLIDIGDIIEARGIVTKTQRGEISIAPGTVRILSKALRPLPNQWDGIKDKEERFRRRYIDMTINPDVRYRFARRAKFWNAVRDFLNQNGFVEVNIPVLEHTTGGADAKPFVTHYDALGEDIYLRISHELPLKRLLGGGFEKVYDIGPRFRNEGISDEHLPEHVAMEWYWAYADYRDGMEFTKQMYRYVMQEVYGTQQFQIKGFDVDLSKEWEIIDFTTVIRERFGIDIFSASLAEMNQILISNGVNLGKDVNMSRVVDNLWKLIRKTIAGPAFLTGVPKFLSPLAKTNASDPRLADRFHPVIAGSELANAFSELNDPVDQLERFLEQQKLRAAGDAEAQMLDIDYVEMLEYGMPPAVGFGLSERVFWFFENVTAKEGVPFPQLKTETDEITQKIYPLLKNIENSFETTEHDHTKRMILVLNKDLTGWQLTNTIGHLSAFLGAQIGKDKVFSRSKFKTQTGDLNANSQYPIVTMAANSSEQLLNLLKRVEEEGLIHLAYTQEMIDFNDDNELQGEYSKKKKEELTYLGIGIFGDNEKLRELTKKFSLWK